MSIWVGLLSREGLARVLQSLIVATLKASRGRAQRKGEDHGMEPWPETLELDGEGSSLGCDSLEMLWISGAVNEMFHLHEAGLEAELNRKKTFGDWLSTIEGAWAAGVRALTFATSGSSGTPRHCTHSFSFLQTEVDFLSLLFSERRRIVACVPAHHIYGFLFSAMLPDRLGVPVVIGIQQPSGLGHWLHQGDLIVSVPEVWRWLSVTVRRWPEGVDGVVSAGPCPRGVLDALVERGLSQITEVYGSSETAGVGVRRWPEPGYRMMPHWTPEERNATAVSVLHSSGLKLALMDRIKWLPDGTFEVAGRLDGAVQIGGVNVYLERIAARLRERPGVSNAELALGAFEHGGRLEAIVVLHQGAIEDEIRPGLEMWMRKHLSTAEQPKRLTFCEAAEDECALPGMLFGS